MRSEQCRCDESLERPTFRYWIMQKDKPQRAGQCAGRSPLLQLTLPAHAGGPWCRLFATTLKYPEPRDPCAGAAAAGGARAAEDLWREHAPAAICYIIIHTETLGS